MRMLWPENPDGELDDEALARLYDFPDTGERPWVAVNFVASVDGAITVAGRSAGLSNAADHKIFALGRDLADVVLVGAGTALIEGYHGVRTRERRSALRQRHGLPETPPLAVVTRDCSIQPDSTLIADTRVPTIILTCEQAPASRRKALADAGAEVVVAGTDHVDLPAAIAALTDRGLRRICCEGGPRLFATLLAARLVDELRLTVSPLLTAGDAARIACGSALPEPSRLTLASVLHHEDVLLLRYRVP